MILSELNLYTCGNALLPGSYPEDGSVVGSVTRRVLQDRFAAPRHRLQEEYTVLFLII
jgi:hypothetical protein